MRPRVQLLERLPVLARRGEDVDDDRPLRTDVHLVRDVRRDVPHAALRELTLLLTDPERDGSADDQPELLVRMAVLGHDAVRLELDDRERAVTTDDGARDDAVPDRDDAHGIQMIERRHAD